jgi:curved DNA-binding protein CbpA
LLFTLYQGEEQKESVSMHHPGRGRREDDLYGILGVRSDAPRQEIVRAYHRAAHAAHPDRQPGDPDAGTRFRVLTEAYDVLSDPDRRARYDTSSRTGQRASRLPSEAAVTARRQPGSQPPKPRKTLPLRTSPLASAPLQAGPVHIEPPAGSLATRARDEPAMPAELTFLVHRYLGGWGWRR